MFQSHGIVTDQTDQQLNIQNIKTSTNNNIMKLIPSRLSMFN